MNTPTPTVTIPRTPTISRKDIAVMIGKHEDTVRNNEKLWGLDKARVLTMNRMILYRTVKVIAILQAQGLI